MKTPRIFFSVIVLVLLSACSKEAEKDIAKSPSEGELLFKNNCKVCHASGINGAPILGNAAMWGPRVTQGKDVLLQHAIDGYGLMPAKGGRSELSDDQVALAIDYMLSQLK